MKNKFFNINDLKAQAQQKPIEVNRDAKLALKFLDEHYAKIDSIKQLVGKTPASGECFFLFTEKSFNTFTFIPYLIKEHGTLHQVTCSTYSINKRILLSLIRLIDQGLIESITIIVADSIKHQRPEVADQLTAYAQANPSKMQVTFVWNHSKILLVQAGEQHYCIEGSGNWSENSRHEQYLFANNEGLYQFRKRNLHL